MKTPGTYSLKFERLSMERQQSVIRLLLSLTTSIVLLKYYLDLRILGFDGSALTLSTVVLISSLLIAYSVIMWGMVRFRPDKLEATMAVGSFVEIILITYLIQSSAGSSIPFYLWYIFYVVSVSTRYGWQHSVLALSASIVSFVGVVCSVPQSYAVNVPAVLGFTGFLLVLAFMFGQISERQLKYQASLAVVNEFRAELSSFTTPREILNHLLSRTREMLYVEHVFFLPAERGSDGSEAPGLRSVGADPVLMSIFRERGGPWNVNEVLREQQPLITNNVARDTPVSSGIANPVGLRNLAAAPMIVRGVSVGVIYAANRRDRRMSVADAELLELLATQAAPVIENAILWERLKDAAASEERLRIARDLHDNFLQTLAAIKLHLERCKILVDKDSDRAIEGIDRIHQIATRGLAEVRVYLSELRLMGPEPSRFKDAVDRCAQDAAARGHFAVDVDAEDAGDALPPNIALAAFQILREMLNNAVHHSEAANVWVRVFRQSDSELVLEVEDDGVGFEVERVRSEKVSQGHMGLIGMEERARQADGSFSLASAPGKGTRATAVLSI